MKGYLYGASVQGIQEFIFKTNKLKEIVGASEIVKDICDDLFFKVAGIDRSYEGLILSTAGNIKCIFKEEDKSKLEALVKSFPKQVMKKAPGITISQAVIKIKGDKKVSDALIDLENILKIQRNIPSVPLETGFMALNRARRTGGIDFEKGEDQATSAKVKNADNLSLFKDFSGINDVKSEELALEINKISRSEGNSWIAVIHADGNGLGNLIQNIGNTLIETGRFYEFSQKIEQSTLAALQKSFNEVVINDKDKFKLNPENNNREYVYPVRPVIVGGDDVTLIIRADLALDFVQRYLKYFEEETKNNLSEMNIPEIADGLTACAGIAYVKNSYPLHYALHLAEDLTKDAKKMVKAEGMLKKNVNTHLPLSSLAFYKVQDSFIEDLASMKARTKKAAASGIDYDYGPYLIDKSDTHASIKDIKQKLELLTGVKDDKKKSVSKLRQLITESFKNKDRMEFMKSRMLEVNKEFCKDIALERCVSGKNGKSILLDLIQLYSFNS